MEQEARPEYKPVPPIIRTPPIKYSSDEDDIQLTGRVNMGYPLFLFTISLALLIGLLSGYTLCN